MNCFIFYIKAEFHTEKQKNAALGCMKNSYSPSNNILNAFSYLFFKLGCKVLPCEKLYHSIFIILYERIFLLNFKPPINFCFIFLLIRTILPIMIYKLNFVIFINKFLFSIQFIINFKVMIMH